MIKAMAQPLFNFRYLRTRLTVLYLGLFGLALVLSAIAIFVAVSASARGVVRDEMRASGAVYDQLWKARSAQLSQGAGVLAQDYGFREAVATNDEATVRSALDNLRARQGVDGALILGTDGYATATGMALSDDTLGTLYNGLDSGRIEAGVLNIEGQPYQMVAAPIMAPVLIGWVVFAERLDAAQMRTLEGLSAIPLSASVVITRGGDGDQSQPMVIPTADGPSMLVVRPLPSVDPDVVSSLRLTYPIDRAMQPYSGLFLWLVLIGGIGLAIMVVGTWALSRGLTRPITALDDAVHRLQQGEYAQAPVTSIDEIGRLATSFNAMVTDLRDRETRLTQMALQDQETGLPNRLAMEQYAQGVTDGWVVLFGIERFAVVRNAIGYDAMALLLTTLAARLSGLSRNTPVSLIGAGALGLVVRAGTQDQAVAMAARVIEAAQTPIKVGRAKVDIALTAGIAGHDAASSDISLIDRAAIAVDQARAARLPAAAFDAATYGDPGDTLSLISDLMAGLRNGSVSLVYQPKYDFRAQTVTGVEALMRWTHPRRGFVSPDLFIGMAEETGHIRPITEWAIRRAIEDHRALVQAGHDMVLSVNISGRLLSDDAFADFALAEVKASGARLCFEITETAVIDHPDVALRIVERFAEAGIPVSLDDYGSGLSSLAYLKQIRADELKIDKAFILTLDESSRDALLVKSTIDLAHSLGLKVTAEGVETASALALLRGMGCDMAQGYFIARPMPMTGLLEFLHASSSVPDTTDGETEAAVA
ncbi:MAG: histidine kinase [Alphaproteobacteria bacterium]|nr:MAG: histidine kinase [Alphaproteobacteria bacterium]